MKKTIIALLVLVLALSVVSSSVFAKETRKVYTEDQVNTLLTQAGVPQDVLNGMDVDTKKFIIENSGDNKLKFVNSSTENFVRDPQTGRLVKQSDSSSIKNFSPLDYIPSSDLKLNLYHFVTNYSGTNMDDIYSSFEWLTTPSASPEGIVKDNFGIAVPDGWQIQSGKYACAVQAWVTNSWGNPNSSLCNNGQPVDYSLYGASWQFGGGAIYTTYYKGTSKLTMVKTNPNAVNRVVTKYSESIENSSGNYNVTVAFGPVEIQYTPSTGSNNVASLDLSW
ncbi:hypothetical protein [Paenibacillus sp. Soil787]|uniref:hypothetical protein n=1 Tax=Paenibacillus sp. Soil787 TaxID=1736411 RepID=UPI0007026CCA|nr:hypothetical protein [Paenibacillus sp. Soil787]KRF20052.1 hypothetical protein ASG93_31650 [Paenibacillus sp. Soil787]